jgi:hypothetical protein
MQFDRRNLLASLGQVADRGVLEHRFAEAAEGWSLVLSHPASLTICIGSYEVFWDKFSLTMISISSILYPSIIKSKVWLTISDAAHIGKRSEGLS